ncbi:hypothetical protein FOL47_000606 [Perkinsus chesapeaki]|uniref:Regulatory protein zeste n=1 Tax=Perkinsus chesapeaki TaxID=330153 RepID=A0A7J6KVD5_PERCH|nr:hypothetical protein FOL47_000606 [Perkinsus chesapeaki]
MSSGKTKKQLMIEKRALIDKEKLQFLSLIEKNYDELTAPFDARLASRRVASHTRDTRTAAWRNIAKMVVTEQWSTLYGSTSAEEIQAARTGDAKATTKLIAFLRDGKWGELKRRFTAKRDKNAQTGSGGGAAAECDDIDRQVERILTSKAGGGKAAIDGLDVDSGGDPQKDEGEGKSTPSAGGDATTVDDGPKDNLIRQSSASLESYAKPPAGIAARSWTPRPRKKQRTSCEAEDLRTELIKVQIAYAKKKMDYIDLLCDKLKAEAAYNQFLGNIALDGD